MEQMAGVGGPARISGTDPSLCWRPHPLGMGIQVEGVQGHEQHSLETRLPTGWQALRKLGYA